MSRNGGAAVLAILSLGVLAAGEAVADRGHWRGDIHYFHTHDLPRWRAGYWHHGHHHGRYGWWWVVGGAWYFYPQPVHPYPDPYIPPVAPVVVAPAPTVVQPPVQYWYYCDAAKNYYPYVATCPDGWRPVPAAPPGPSEGDKP